VLDGRDTEVERLRALVAAARSGARGAVLVVGDAGIGKSTLLDAAVAEATGLTVLRTRGLEGETTLPFASLAALVEPLMHLRAALPVGQAESLASALSLRPPTAYDRFAVPMAVRGLLRAAAAERPVLAVVDDLHWLDPASRDALLFVARRLEPVGVALVLATRADETADPSSAGVDVVALAPLDAASARRIVEGRHDRLDRQTVEQVVTASGGNPLALLELSRLADEGGLVALMSQGLPLAAGPLVERVFARQFDALAPDARRAAGIAAAMEGGTLAWLLGALARQGLAPGALDELERARILLVRDDRLAFRHPLLRAAAYHSTAPQDRRAAHTALAATAPDPARRAWQLAAAAGEEDAEAADALEDAARHARHVGGHAEAATAFARAASLSAGEQERGARELEAARDWAIAGRVEAALELLDGAARRAPAAAQPAVARLRGNLLMRHGAVLDAVSLLLAEAGRYEERGDAAGAVEVLVECALGPIFTADIALSQRILERAEPTAKAAGGPGEVLVDMLAAAQLGVTGRNPEAEAALRRAEARLGEVDVLQHSEMVVMAAQSALWLGADARAGRILAMALSAYERASAVGRMPYALAVRAQLRLRQGRWPDAAGDAREAALLARDTGQALQHAFALATLARVQAWTGDLHDAHDTIDVALSLVAGMAAEGVEQHVLAAQGSLLLIAGRPGEAVGVFERCREIEDRRGILQPALTGYAGDHVEALVAVDRHDAARERQAALARAAEMSGSTWARAVVARGALLLAPDDAAGVENLAERALRAHDADGTAHERARTELVAGQRLRRLHARAASRPLLLRAAATFERLGAHHFAEVARRELLLAGSGASPPVRTTRVAELAGQELAIARLVAEGRTNRAIAAELLLSEKTLERRLTALYRRLDLAGRTELAALVSGSGLA
jgi:DNA-binding CsgD family transcriptional regulator